jgi:hypothetical protein
VGVIAVELAAAVDEPADDRREQRAGALGR